MWNARFTEALPEDWQTPSPTVTELLGLVLADRPAGTAIELGCGPGRHALWLAERGWRVTGVDFSSVAIDQARRAAAARGLTVDWVLADVTEWAPDQPVDLVFGAFIHLPSSVLAKVPGWLAPGGRFVLIAHSIRNEQEGEAGPRHPAMLYAVDELSAAVSGLGIDHLEETVDQTPDGRRTVLVRLIARRTG